MQRIMTYQEANSVLESSLSPLSRCLTKSVAAQNNADTSLLVAFVDNRLVSASVIALAEYNVTFKDWDNSVLKTAVVKHGHQAEPPADPSRSGYTFTGWDPSSLVVSQDTIFTAQYAAQTYSVDWFVQYPDETEQRLYSYKHDYTYGQSTVIPETPGYTQGGYSFAGWERHITNSGINNIPQTVTENMEFYGTFVPTTYRIEFVATNPMIQVLGGSNFDTVIGTEQNPIWYGDTINVPDSSAVLQSMGIADEYDIIGWQYTGINGQTHTINSSTITCTENITATAILQVKKYRIVFRNWNNEELKKQLLDYGDMPTPPSNVPDDPYGHAFSTWNPAVQSVTNHAIYIAQYTAP